jgi:16S rRNA (guanine966-N2)-methyltransferase
MRIIAGSLKGKRLSVPRQNVRPTSERLRGGFFDALGEAMLMDSVWLDLFAGSGAVGIEALSRGAKHVVFNDRDRFSYKIIKENIERCGLTEGFSLYRKDAFVVLRDPPSVPGSGAVSILFMDPPYDFGRYGKLLAKAIASPLVGRETLLALEIFKKTRLNFVPEELSITRVLKGGDNHILFLVPD